MDSTQFVIATMIKNEISRVQLRRQDSNPRDGELFSCQINGLRTALRIVEGFTESAFK